MCSILTQSNGMFNQFFIRCLAWTWTHASSSLPTHICMLFGKDKQKQSRITKCVDIYFVYPANMHESTFLEIEYFASQLFFAHESTDSKPNWMPIFVQFFPSCPQITLHMIGEKQIMQMSLTTIEMTIAQMLDATRITICANFNAIRTDKQIIKSNSCSVIGELLLFPHVIFRQQFRSQQDAIIILLEYFMETQHEGVEITGKASFQFA